MFMKKLYVIAIIMTLLLSVLALNVNAADLSFTTSLKPSSTTVEKGKEFTVNINVSNLKVGDNGINTLEGYLEVDKDVFEEVSEDSFEGLDNWGVKFTPDTGKVILTSTKFLKESKDICQITLKTQSNATAKQGAIEFTDIKASNSVDEITAQDVSLEIKVGSGSSSSSNSIRINTSNTNTDTNTNTTNTNSNTNSIRTNTLNSTNSNNSSNSTNSLSNLNTTSNNTNRNSNVNTNTNESKEEEMPNTGIDDSIVKAILLVALVGALGYIKFRSLDNK